MTPGERLLYVALHAAATIEDAGRRDRMLEAIKRARVRVVPSAVEIGEQMVLTADLEVYSDEDGWRWLAAIDLDVLGASAEMRAAFAAAVAVNIAVPDDASSLDPAGGDAT